jgi:hypothetical protein
VAYGGNIFHRGYWDALRELADALAGIGGQLLVFGPSEADVIKNGLARPNVVAKGFAPKMAEAMRAEANVLYLPMTFEEQERPNMSVSFPSKLAEYTATGLPILIQGPAYCSAVRWARENPGTTEVVSEPGGAALLLSLHRLADPAHRRSLARQAMETGRRYFSFEVASRVFHEALRSASRR